MSTTEQQSPETPRGRLVMPGHNTEDGSWCMLRVTQEADGAWTVRCPAPGVVLTALDMVALVEAILGRAR
jgi:mannose/cellobiose epimerase-like protein (N-acyl-D-glucosamine 2-epimerase family)